MQTTSNKRPDPPRKLDLKAGRRVNLGGSDVAKIKPKTEASDDHES